MSDDEQLVALFHRICKAWTDGDAQTYGACFTDAATMSPSTRHALEVGER